MIEYVQLFLYGVWISSMSLFLYLVITNGNNIIKIVSFITYSQSVFITMIITYVHSDTNLLSQEITMVVYEAFMVVCGIHFWKLYSKEGWK